MGAAPSIVPPARAARLRRLALPVACLAGAAALYLAVMAGAGLRHQDLETYLAAGRDLLQGRPLYAPFLHHPFPDPALRPAYIYPPAFAVLVAPLTLLPVPVAAAVWEGLTQAALALSLYAVGRRLRAPPTAAILALALTLAFYPLWIDLIQGQANLLILLLVSLGISTVLSGHPQGAAALGVAAGLKLSPAILAGWLLWERRFREAAWMAGGFAATTALGALVRYQDTMTFFRQVLPALATGTPFYANQSPSGLLARLFTRNAYTHPWVALPWEPVAVVGASLFFATWWASWCRRQPDPTARAIAFLPLLPLLSAIAWSHHLVIVLPLLWLTIVHLAHRRWPLPETAVLVLVAGCLSVLPQWHPGPAFGEAGFVRAQTSDPLVLVTANSLLAGTVLLFVTSPWLLRSR